MARGGVDYSRFNNIGDSSDEDEPPERPMPIKKMGDKIVKAHAETWTVVAKLASVHGVEDTPESSVQELYERGCELVCMPSKEQDPVIKLAKRDIEKSIKLTEQGRYFEARKGTFKAMVRLGLQCPPQGQGFLLTAWSWARYQLGKTHKVNALQGGVLLCGLDPRRGREPDLPGLPPLRRPQWAPDGQKAVAPLPMRLLRFAAEILEEAADGYTALYGTSTDRHVLDCRTLLSDLDAAVVEALIAKDARRDTKAHLQSLKGAEVPEFGVAGVVACPLERLPAEKKR